MSKIKKITLILVIAAIGYAITIPPNGKYFIPVAKLIKAKSQTEKYQDHSLDLKNMR